MRKILVVGGAGYCASLLVPQLVNEGWEVTVYDTMWYDPKFPKHPKLHVIEGDVRDTEKVAKACEGQEYLLHLACISNDVSFDLDEQLSTSINLESFEPLVLAAKKAGVKRFVFASSSSVYGVSEAPDVSEDHPLIPLTLYSKYKGMCEPLLFKHTDKNFVGVVFRPATVCGYAPRTRLDLSVNEKIANETFNCGFQNMSILDIAKTVKKVVEEQFPEKGDIPLEITPSDDLRSYHINSDKILTALGFKPKHTIEEAVVDLCKAFREGMLPNSFDDDRYYNVRKMKAIGAK